MESILIAVNCSQIMTRACRGVAKLIIIFEAASDPRLATFQLFEVAFISNPYQKMFQRDPRAGAFLGGDRVSGQDIRDQNGVCMSRLNHWILLNIIAKCIVDHSYRGAVHREHREEFVRSIRT